MVQLTLKSSSWTTIPALIGGIGCQRHVSSLDSQDFLTNARQVENFPYQVKHLLNKFDKQTRNGRKSVTNENLPGRSCRPYRTADQQVQYQAAPSHAGSIVMKRHEGKEHWKTKSRS